LKQFAERQLNISTEVVAMGTRMKLLALVGTLACLFILASTALAVEFTEDFTIKVEALQAEDTDSCTSCEADENGAQTFSYLVTVTNDTEMTFANVKVQGGNSSWAAYQDSECSYDWDTDFPANKHNSKKPATNKNWILRETGLTLEPGESFSEVVTVQGVVPADAEDPDPKVNGGWTATGTADDVAYTAFVGWLTVDGEEDSPILETLSLTVSDFCPAD
jgi:hypothetical protein